jgi:hypothetical protein
VRLRFSERVSKGPFDVEMRFLRERLLR